MRSIDASGFARSTFDRIVPIPSLLREYRASTEARSSGVTFGRSAADGGGTRASPVMRMGWRKEAQNAQKGEARKRLVGGLAAASLVDGRHAIEHRSFRLVEGRARNRMHGMSSRYPDSPIIMNFKTLTLL